MMEYFSDIFLGAAAIGAAVYCLLLSRKLSRLRGLDQDLGGAIAVLSTQVDEMTNVLRDAQKSAEASSADLQEISERAEAASERLELLVAAVHDLAEPPSADQEQPEMANPSGTAEADQPLFRSRSRLNGSEKTR